MVNQQKIIVMTKLALYDKHTGSADRAANEYFRHDYIYKKNLGTRLAVGLGAVLILAIYWVGVLFVGEEVDVFELNIQAHLTEAILFVLAVLAVYSLIGTIQGTREYYLVQKRLNEYQTNMRTLERMNERRKRPTPREENISHARRREMRVEARRAERRANLNEPRLDSLGGTSRTKPITRSVNSEHRKDNSRKYGKDSDST